MAYFFSEWDFRKLTHDVESDEEGDTIMRVRLAALVHDMEKQGLGDMADDMFDKYLKVVAGADYISDDFSFNLPLIALTRL